MLCRERREKKDLFRFSLKYAIPRTQKVIIEEEFYSSTNLFYSLRFCSDVRQQVLGRSPLCEALKCVKRSVDTRAYVCTCVSRVDPCGRAHSRREEQSGQVTVHRWFAVTK